MSDLAKLFSEDPLKLTKEDRAQIIAHYREARTQFNLGAKDAGAAKKLKGAAAPKITNLDSILGDF